MAATLALGLGIWLGKYWQISPVFLVIGWLAVFLIFSLAIKRFEALALSCLLLGFFGLGNFIYGQKNLKIQQNPWKVYFNQLVSLEGEVSGFPYFKNENQIFIFKADRLLLKSGKEIPVDAQVQVRMESTPQLPGILWGERLKICGELLEPWGLTNPKGFDYRRYLALQGIKAVVSIKTSDNLEILSQGFSWKLFLARLREKFLGSLDQGFSDEVRGVLLGIVLGETHKITPEIYQAFRESGTLHVLAASGSNVAVFTAFVFLIFGLLGFSTPVRALLAISASPIYAFLAAFSPSVVRAAIMASFALLAVYLEREDDILNLLFLSAFLILINNPLTLYDVSFQMSFLCVLGIFWLYPLLAEPFKKPVQEWSKKLPVFMRGFPGFILDATVISLSAQLMLIPVLSNYFHQISLIGFLANLLIVPLSGVLMVGGVIQAVLGLISHYLAWPLMVVNWVLVKTLLGLVDFFHKIPGAFIWVAAFSIWGFLFYYGLLYFLSGFFIKKSSGFQYLMAGFLLLCLVLNQVYAGPTNPRMTFFDLGKGKAIWLSLPGGQNWLFDSGAYDYEGSQLPGILLANGVSKIDAFYITSAHPYCTGSALSLLEKIKVKNLYWAKTRANFFLDPIEKSAIRRKVVIHNLSLGQVLTSPNLKLKVMEVIPQAADLTLSLEIKDRKILLLGESCSFEWLMRDAKYNAVYYRRKAKPDGLCHQIEPELMIIDPSMSRIQGAKIYLISREGAITLEFLEKKLNIIKEKQQEEIPSK